MRKPDLAKFVTIGASEYTTAAMLREFVWGNPYWAQDEATSAAFERLTAKPDEMEDADFDRVCSVLRQLSFPAHASIECAHLRNKFVLTPKEKDPIP